MSQFFNYIFVDVGCDITPLQQSVLDLASAVLVVVNPEILVVNQTKRILGELSHLPSGLFHLLVNRAGSSGLSAGAISGTLRCNLLAVFSEEDGLSASLHSSKPHVLSQPQAPFSKSCHDLIRKLNSGLLQRGENK